MESREGGDIGGGGSAFLGGMQTGGGVDAFEERMAHETRAGVEGTRFGQAAAEAASALALAPSGWVLEKALERELLASLAGRLGGGVDWYPTKKLTIPTWTAGLGGVDLVGEKTGSLVAVAELKIHNADE